MTLDQIGLRFGTDKASNRHNFLDAYERYLAPLRDSAVSVAEIGVFNGASLRMWAEFFPAARIVGLDVKRDLVAHRTDRIAIEIGNAGQPRFLTEVCERHGPFDLVVDDGSHLWDHQQMAFRLMFPHVKPGGIYILEDINTSFVPRYGRGRGAVPTTVWLKHYMDYLLAAGSEPNAPKDAEDEVARMWRRDVAEVALIRKSAIIVKAVRPIAAAVPSASDEA